MNCTTFVSSLSRLPVLFLTFSFFIFLSMVYSTESLSFSFTGFEPEPHTKPDLIFQRDAMITTTGILQLTGFVGNTVGRALYSSPFHIWDNATGNVASFVTSFSFIIIDGVDDEPKTVADGLAFFLAPVDTQPQGSGGLLGLFPDQQVSKSHKVVAVEFDTYSNDWDPQGTHIGINVNGIKSVKTTPWPLKNGRLAKVSISYDASSKVLTASLVYPTTSTQDSYIISSVVDIKNVLPEFVRVGFSASTGLRAELHSVYTWSFESKFSDGANGEAAFSNAHGLDSSI